MAMRSLVRVSCSAPKGDDIYKQLMHQVKQRRDFYGTVDKYFEDKKRDIMYRANVMKTQVDLVATEHKWIIDQETKKALRDIESVRSTSSLLDSLDIPDDIIEGDKEERIRVLQEQYRIIRDSKKHKIVLLRSHVLLLIQLFIIAAVLCK